MLSAINRPEGHIDLVGFGTDGIYDQNTFDMAIQHGYRLFDSADLYGNSDMLSEAIKKSDILRAEFFINYKIFPKLGKEEFLIHVNSAISKFNYIDCLMLHDTITTEKESLSEILESLRPYLESGKIKSLGVSNTSDTTLKDLLKDFPEIKLIQNNFSHVHQDENIRTLCKEVGIRYMGYGLFGGRDDGACTYSFNIYKAAWNLSEVAFPVMHDIARKYQISPHDMLLTWAILQGTIQIPSTTKEKNMAANLEARKKVSQILPEDQEKLAASLNLQASAQQWTHIEELATQGDRLAKLKVSIGNQLSRHRLLKKVYHDDALKPLYDLLLDQRTLSDDSKLVQKQTRINKMRINALTHFLEESLKAGDDQFQEAVNHLKNICEMSINDAEKNGLFDLIDALAKQIPFSIRRSFINGYFEERSFLKENGYFQVEEIEPELKRNDRFLITIGIVGPNKKIYIVRNVSNSTSLQALSELLAEKFPNDFKNKNTLKSFYIPHEDMTIDSLSTTLQELRFANGDMIDIKQPRESNNFSRFFHRVTETPQAFIGTNQPIKKTFKNI